MSYYTGDNIPTNPYKEVGGRNEYGGQVIQLQFDHPPTDLELSTAAHQFDSCPFGWRTISRSGNIVTIKIHND